MKRRVTASFIVLVHISILMMHGTTHLRLHIDMQGWQSAFIATVIFVGPVLATALLWMGLHRTGVALLALTMAGSLVFGIAYHFVISGPDNVFNLHLGHREDSLFVMSAIALGLIEAGAVFWNILQFTDIQRLRRMSPVRVMSR